MRHQTPYPLEVARNPTPSPPFLHLQIYLVPLYTFLIKPVSPQEGRYCQHSISNKITLLFSRIIILLPFITSFTKALLSTLIHRTRIIIQLN
jgi:hypothetical protein